MDILPDLSSITNKKDLETIELLCVCNQLEFFEFLLSDLENITNLLFKYKKNIGILYYYDVNIDEYGVYTIYLKFKQNENPIMVSDAISLKSTMFETLHEYIQKYLKKQQTLVEYNGIDDDMQKLIDESVKKPNYIGNRVSRKIIRSGNVVFEQALRNLINIEEDDYTKQTIIQQLEDYLELKSMLLDTNINVKYSQLLKSINYSHSKLEEYCALNLLNKLANK